MTLYLVANARGYYYSRLDNDRRSRPVVREQVRWWRET